MRHIPNIISVIRILLVVPIAITLFHQRLALAVMLFALAAVSDAADGFLAKRFGWQSWIGGMLDPIADKLLLMAAFVWLALAGELPVWLAGLVVGRDLAIVLGAIAYHNLIGRFDAAPSGLSKLTTVIQIVFLLVELLRLSNWVAMPPLLRTILIVVTAGFTLASGLHYVVVWGARARHSTRLRDGR